MSLLFDDTSTMKDHIQSCLADDFARNATRSAQGNFNARREAQMATYEGWETYRAQMAQIRDDVLSHLDYYLSQFIEKTTANGNIVHFADTAEDAQRILLDICHAKNAKSVVKSKSMVSEEIDCNNTLLADGIEVNETDLGEYMVQLDNWNHPSHLIMPGMHMDIKATYDLFVEQGYSGAMEAHEMTLFARAKLRQKFLAADIGITGCNFAIASTGSTSILTNEGNGRMVTSLPETQIVLMGMERLLPNMQAFDAMMQIFVRCAVGTTISSYMSFTNGPRTADAQDGAKEVHIILIDNGRSKILGSKYNKMLRCVRCGTCQNVCPVFRHITGHGYGACYQGPMGILYTPLLQGFDELVHLALCLFLLGFGQEHACLDVHEVGRHGDELAGDLHVHPLHFVQISRLVHLASQIRKFFFMLLNHLLKHHTLSRILQNLPVIPSCFLKHTISQTLKTQNINI